MENLTIKTSPQLPHTVLSPPYISYLLVPVFLFSKLIHFHPKPLNTSSLSPPLDMQTHRSKEAETTDVFITWTY